MIASNIKLIREVASLSREKFGAVVGVSGDAIYTYENGRSQPKDLVKKRIADLGGISTDDLEVKQLEESDIHINTDLLEGVDDNSTNTTIKRPTGADIRKKKATSSKEEIDPGLIFVPIFAQAGYTKHYLEPMYERQLERVKIPFMPYKGDRYRIFEVSDDSMEPTLKEHFHVVAERVDPEFWNSVSNFYMHVIVTIDQIMIKRVFNLDDETFVMISDNEEFYPQFQLHKKDIKELWLVKRKLDWELAPPKKFEIKVKR